MSMGMRPACEPVPDHEQKKRALGYLWEAWAEARLDGVAHRFHDARDLVRAQLACHPQRLQGTGRLLTIELLERRLQSSQFFSFHD